MTAEDLKAVLHTWVPEWRKSWRPRGATRLVEPLGIYSAAACPHPYVMQVRPKLYIAAYALVEGNSDTRNATPGIALALYTVGFLSYLVRYAVAG